MIRSGIISFFFFVSLGQVCQAKSFYGPRCGQAFSHFESAILVNTSNPTKQAEFKRIFGGSGVEVKFSNHDVQEVQADPVTVAVHKASQFTDPDKVVIIEDSSLDVEGASVGVNVKHLIDQLPNYIGRRAVWRVVLAYRDNEGVHVFQDTVQGKIVPKRGDEPGFGPVFQPDGAAQTLTELGNTPQFSARARAVNHFLKGEEAGLYPPIKSWQGSYQPH